MSRSIRQTLPLWNFAVLSIVLALFGGVLYASVSSGLYRNIDNTLVLQADAVAESIFAFREAERAATPSAPGNWQAAPSPAIAPERFSDLIGRWARKTGILESGRAICIFDSSGRPVAASEGFVHLGISPMPADSETLAGKTVFKTDKISEGRIRWMIRPILERGKTVYLIQTAESLSQADTSLHELRLWLVSLIPSALLVTSLIAWFLISTALKPLGRMAFQARQIHAQALDRRIDVPETKDEFERLARIFNEMLDRLERAFKRIRQFSAAASHELRTPLTVMRGEVEVALRRPREGEEYRRVLCNQLETLQEMASTVEELLTLARGDASEGAMERRPVMLDAVVDQVSESLRPLAQAKSVALLVSKQRGVEVRGERRLLKRLISNLLDNAIRHTPPEGRVNISVTRVDAMARISVQDTGSGISSKEIPEIFDRFFIKRSSSEGTTTSTSTGIGLGLCRWIAEVHQGRIDVSSPPGEGATFTVWLPLLSL
ncbi:MAG: HAMP domain-containing protein [Candidatus Omnitrophica bacterium]|nr:HAMP domain-containing protein [Candidatus Omnitrophota bacterium]